ncbi:unnamed protein product [Caenorhabditis bovis]|uniref:Uncharacterized protein n=1 Tax=Caenorhabditis bovis TaxID=2654633 RepID=A0A8S1EUS1_9PELO|nr:unnamed protein product [Caenorhabditis bovis]
MSVTTSYGSSFDSESNVISLDNKIISLELLSDNYEKYVEKAEYLEYKVKDYRRNHRKNEKEMSQKLAAMKNSFERVGNELREACDNRLAKLKQTLQPLLSFSPEAIQSVGQKLDENEETAMLKHKIMKIMSKISGIEATAKSTTELSARQNDAIARFEEVTRVLALANDIPQSDERFNIVNAPMALLALTLTPNIAPFYRQKLKSLEERLSVIAAQLRFNNGSTKEMTTLDGEVTTTSLSTATDGRFKNGEISGKSTDPTEYPVARSL